MDRHSFLLRVSHGQALPSFSFFYLHDWERAHQLAAAGEGYAWPDITCEEEKHQPLPCRGNWKPGLAMIRKKRQARHLWDRNKVGNRATALCDPLKGFLLAY